MSYLMLELYILLTTIGSALCAPVCVLFLFIYIYIFFSEQVFGKICFRFYSIFVTQKQKCTINIVSIKTRVFEGNDLEMNEFSCLALETQKQRTLRMRERDRDWVKYVGHNYEK